jgi:hypothetical protein
VFFISADIADFELVMQDDLVCGVEVSTATKTDVEKLAQKVNSVVANDIARQIALPAKVIWRSAARQEYEPDIFDRLLERGMVFEAAEGQVSLGEPLISLMDGFDTRLRHMATTLLDAREYRYPTLIPTKVLQECGYFDSFPHMLMFVTRLHNDVDTYQAFSADYQTHNGMGPFALTYCENTDYCLPPTMCYHTYHQLRNRHLAEGQNLVITSKGKSFRFESKYHRTMERLWDFTIREIVFLGTKDFVLDCRQRYMEAAFALVEQLGLVGYCEVANDPFFCNADTARKIFSQKMLELKYELRLNVGDARTIAVASFNFHDQVFGEGFNIKGSDGDWIRTACVGFGLERLVYAFLCQYGLDERNWPLDVIQEGGSNVKAKS